MQSDGWTHDLRQAYGSTCDCWCVGTYAYVSERVENAKPVIREESGNFDMTVLFKSIIPFAGGERFLGWVQVWWGIKEIR